MIIEFDLGDKVINPNNKEWGVGLVQSILNDKMTVNFENVGKKVVMLKIIKLEKLISYGNKPK